MTTSQPPRGTVLLVEDDADLSFVVALTLREAGFTVACASNGQEAMDQLRADPVAPSLILLDHMMPVMNGTEFRAAQLQDPALAAIPVVLMSGDGDVKKRAAALQVDDYLVKPVDLDDLLRTVRQRCRAPTPSPL